MFATNKKNAHGFVIRAYCGDAKTLLAFDLPEEGIKNFAGFTIACTPKGKPTYYLYNQLQFVHPEKHAQNKNEPTYSTINAPIQKFRWLHVPGLFHQDDDVFYGNYTYTVTPRYFDENGLLEVINKNLSSEVAVEVEPFKKGSIELAFTRGFVQSQGFANHFGNKAPFKPKNAKLLFNTSAIAGKNNKGDSYSFKDEYVWSGFTARDKIFSILQQVQGDDDLSMDVFAYDLNEPDIMRILLQLGREGRIRIILDNAKLHHDKDGTTAEDQFEAAFRKQAKTPEAILRGSFERYQHNKVFIVKKNNQALYVLTGSTNFSVTGLYVNSNHIAVFHDLHIAEKYQEVFDEAWQDNVSGKKFQASPNASKTFSFDNPGLPQTHISFSPHENTFAGKLLDKIVERINQEESSVLFAVMETDEKAKGPVAPALIHFHKRTDLFSCGITDSTNDIHLYKASSPEGLRITAKQGQTLLPPPFDKEESIGIGHQIHHKFIVCGFNTKKPVVWFGSSNLALGGEEENGDNLIEVHDEDLATVFAIEAISLVDHFHFRDKHVMKKENKEQDHTGPYHLFTDSKWAQNYFDPGDLRYLDREVFMGKKIKELKTSEKKVQVKGER